MAHLESASQAAACEICDVLRMSSGRYAGLLAFQRTTLDDRCVG